MRSLVFCSALVLVLPALADDKTDAEFKALAGKYEITKAEIGGKDITEELKVLRLEMKEGGKYTATHGEEKDDGTYTVDLAKKPKEMDVKPANGPHKGKLVKAIYKLDGDALTICYDFGEKGERPTKFESPADTSFLLVTYKRKK